MNIWNSMSSEVEILLWAKWKSGEQKTRRLQFLRQRFLAEIPEELVERRQHTQPRFVQQAKPRPRPTMPHSDTLGSHHASGPVIDFRKGDTVEHDVFGRGLVLSVLPTGNDKMLEIAFDQIGTKRLMANFAASRMKKL